MKIDTCNAIQILKSSSKSVSFQSNSDIRLLFLKSKFASFYLNTYLLTHTVSMYK